jgi:hypothetical protein
VSPQRALNGLNSHQTRTLNFKNFNLYLLTTFAVKKTFFSTKTWSS